MKNAGLKELEKSGCKLDKGTLAGITSKLAEKFPRLKVKLIQPEKRRTMYDGEEIQFQITGLPFPDIDLYSGQFAKNTKQAAGVPFRALFEGVDGPISAKCTYNPKTGTLKTMIPDGSITGMVILQVPTRLITGPLQSKTRKELVKSMSLCTPLEKNIAHEQALVHIPYVLCCLDIGCRHCVTHSLCPYGAIKFKNGLCYVDEEMCRGLSHSVYTEWLDGERRNVRSDEVKCWECFSGGESLSSKCLHRRIGRVLQIGSSDENCCGGCPEQVQVVPGVCLREHCRYGAISGGNPDCLWCGNQSGFDNLTGPFVVDKNKCVGCMVCYNNCVCEKLDMAAYIKYRIGAFLTFDEIRHTLPPISPSAKKLTLEIWGRGLTGIIHRKLRLDSSGKPVLVEDFFPSDKLGGIHFIDVLYMTVVEGAHTVLGSSLWGGAHSPQKTSIILRNIIGSSVLGAYSGTMKLSQSIELDYQLRNIHYY